MIFTICILLLVYNIGREFLFYKERQKMLDRIQSNSLPEYKAFEQPKKPKEKEKEIELL